MPTRTAQPRAALHIGDEALRRMPNVFGPLDQTPLKTSGAHADTEQPVAGMRLRVVELTAIVEHSLVQTRAPFDPDHDEDDAALLRSLETEGQKNPILLDELDGDGPPRYRLKGGHRRVAALRRLGRSRAVALIARSSSLESDLLALTDNVRKNLSPLELGHVIARLRERHSLSTPDIVARTGLSRQYLHLVDQLAALGPELSGVVEQGQLSAKAACALARAPHEWHASLAELATARDVSEREARELAGRLSSGASLEGAAQALGFRLSPAQSSDAQTRVAENSGVAGDVMPATPTSPRRRVALGRRPSQTLGASTALSWLDAHFQDLPSEAKRALAAAAAAANADLPTLKLATLLVLAGVKPALAVEQAALIKTETCARRVLALLEAQLDLAELARRGKFIATLAPTLTVLAGRMKALQAARDQGVNNTTSEQPDRS